MATGRTTSCRPVRTNGSAACKHIIAYADERDAQPCPVCELAKWKSEHKHLSKALVDLQVKLVDIEIPIVGIGDEVRED